MMAFESDETVGFTLFFPSEANIDDQKISVLDPWRGNARVLRRRRIRVERAGRRTE
jgi:hypothetical protein